jgi:hypothetical protein
MSEQSDLKKKIKLAKRLVEDEPDPYKIEAFKVILSKLIEQRSIAEIIPEITREKARLGEKPIKANGKSLKIDPTMLEMGKFYLVKWKGDEFSVRKISKTKIEVYEVIPA